MLDNSFISLFSSCISDHGRESRCPFLDEDVVSFLNALPVWIKVCLHLFLCLFVLVITIVATKN